MRKIIEIEADVRSIPASDLDQEPNGQGEMYYKLDFDIEMSCRSASLTFAIVYRDRHYETVRQECV